MNVDYNSFTLKVISEICSFIFKRCTAVYIENNMKFRNGISVTRNHFGPSFTQRITDPQNSSYFESIRLPIPFWTSSQDLKRCSEST